MTSLLTKYNKCIAWFFAGALYLELTAACLVANANDSPGIRKQYYAANIWLERISSTRASNKMTTADTKVHHRTEIDPSQVSYSPFEIERLNDKFTTGPGQPEMQAFGSVNNANMVDLFTGDFSYNIPLMDVGGYPINLSYRSGISMDQEASWVGLGWNVNPGTITRNMRGLPDDFNGKNDSVKKVISIKENKTVGATVGADLEIVGLPFSFGASFGIFNNNYKGWGLEYGLNSSINSGGGAMGTLSAGLSITNNTQEGVSVSPSMSYRLASYNDVSERGVAGSFNTSLTYNSRSGLKGLQLGVGIRQLSSDNQNQLQLGRSSSISFASPGYTPSITIPFTSNQFSFTAKLGGEITFFHPNIFISGYSSRQRIERKDTLLALPSYGYLHFQEGAQNRSSLLDFNREKELPYREKPAVPHIAVPSYTYDAFSITGEGTGGMFRAYRGDIGFIHDHFIRSKDESDNASVDLGSGNLAHLGLDINITRAFTQNGPWLNQNSLKNVIDFRRSDSTFEAVYFRNPGEKPLNSQKFYETIGGDDVVTVDLSQSSPHSSVIQATNYLTRYRNKRAVGKKLLTPHNAVKDQRDKRSQVISYLTAKEADVVGLSKFIENYTINTFNLANCNNGGTEVFEGQGSGLRAEYYPKLNHEGAARIKSDSIYFDWGKGKPRTTTNVAYFSPFPEDEFSIRWVGRIKAPVTGQYVFRSFSDDGIRLWLNDSLLKNHNQWTDHGRAEYKDTVYLLSGEMYKIRVEYYEKGGKSEIKLEWKYPSLTNFVAIPKTALYPPAIDTFRVNNYLVKEKRLNSFRKENHISQINVLNEDGRRYVYGIPVYNLRQKEATFSVDGNEGNATTGLVKYSGNDNTAGNTKGKDRYYNSEEMPAYAHSFLLTGILSADYVDVTDNGISDDDIGDAVKFNYSKIRGVKNPFRWRAPAALDSATFNEGMKTDSRDDKGNYVYGEKELWYLHSVESKTMVAVFKVESRLDVPSVAENGSKLDGEAKRIKEISLYTKADLLKYGTLARPTKTAHFEYSYELCKGSLKPLSDSGKLTLKKIWFTYNGNDKGRQNPYVFNYNSNNPTYNIKSYDRWGNFKDPLENPGSTSGNIITNAEYPYALQDSIKAASNAGAWALDSIMLPSGGSMKILYESDDYGFVQHKRAMQLFKIIGLGSSSTMPGTPSQKLYNSDADHLFVYVAVPGLVTTAKDVFQKYLTGIKKLYFKLYVEMPSHGYEYVSCFANLDQGNSYGVVNSNIIWIKLTGISLKGDGGGSYSPLAKAAIQFLRLNLPAQAYPGSEVGDDLGPVESVKLLVSIADNIKTSLTSFDAHARTKDWAVKIDTARSFIRLNNASYKKYGGGHRVKKVTIYDNWDKMTGRRPAIYGQEYLYKTNKSIDGNIFEISSGVASYEPNIGAEENPFRQPIEYLEQIAPLAPVSLGYSEEPLGESFYPGPSVGYSKVRVRSINHKNVKSANGFEQTEFYTAYDFPTYVDKTLIDDDNKKRYKPAIANFLRINAKHYMNLSQGFKIELNDMHGKIKSQASFPQTDPNNYVTYTEYIYRSENVSGDQKKLVNDVMLMRPNGDVDSAGVIGKDIELMVDMREQQSVTNGYNLNLNSDMFTTSPIPPFFLIPMALNLAQREENLYRSVATTKVIQRYGILDSVIHVDKGSKISTKDILYDGETGNILLTRTQNEFNDPVYNFNYPSHWAYDGMGLAYKNIDLTLHHLTIRDGRITSGLANPNSAFFSSGDEILAAGRRKAGSEVDCAVDTATFPIYERVWAIDTSLVSNVSRAIYFVDKDGKPYNGFDASFKIVRSGRRNIHTSVGSVTTLENPLIKDTVYRLVLNTSSKILNAGSQEFKQYWNVEDIKKNRMTRNCIESPVAVCDSSSTTQCTNECLRKLFDYLISSKRLFIKKGDNIILSQLIQDANTANPSLDLNANDCPLFTNNGNNAFYAITSDSVSNYYRAMIGNCTVGFNSIDGRLVPFYSLSFKDYTSNRPSYSYSLGVIDNSFQKTFGGSGNDQSHHSIQTSDNGVLVIGQTNGFSSVGIDGYVTKLDSNGTIQWSKTYGGSNLDVFVKGKQTADGGYILGGFTYSFGATYGAAWLTKVDASGNLTWSKKYTDGNIRGDRLFDLIQTSDGGYAFSGDHKYIEDSVDILVVRTDATGSILWAKAFNSGAGDEGYAIHEHNDTLLVSGFYTEAMDDLDAILMKINKSNGNLIWSKGWDFGNRSNRLGTIFTLADGYLMNGVSANGFFSDSASHLVVKTDFQGNIIYAKELATTPSTMNGYSYPTPEGGYFAETIQKLTDTSSDIFVTKVAADGIVSWSERFSNVGQQLHAGIIRSPNGVITALANTNGGGSNVDIQVIRTDTSGMPLGCNTNAISAVNTNPIITGIDLEWSSITNITFETSQTVTPTVSTVSPILDTICQNVPTDAIIAFLETEFCQSCDTIIDLTCRSLLVDTAFNPYVTGVWGNWRPNRSLTYYGRRADSDPTSTTNIRTNGTFFEFSPYWIFNNNSLVSQPDTSRWVWNSEITRYNRKGFEVENRDPLGRFNSGLYGYNLTMPVAVIQNARFRESAFDGFEDYDFVTRVCDTACMPTRHLDFTSHKSKLDTTQSHSGKSSLKLNPAQDAAVTVNIATISSDTASFKLAVSTKTNCSNPVLDKIIAPSSVLSPSFSPLQGKKMVLSAWVKENQDCHCISYTQNRITVSFSGGSSSSISFAPSGSIIEGWQRYESVFEIPVDATSMTVALQSTDSATVYFDDLRIHPFNGNMKSFVYNPLDLKLMAELDENNYAAFYEYDDDGTLIRVKKETQRGIKTIKETRSALLKQ